MIKREKGNYRYFDKNGVEITEGCKIRYANGNVKTVYLTDGEELGTDATNPIWVASGRAAPCEYGVYPLEWEETEEVEVVEIICVRNLDFPD